MESHAEFTLGGVTSWRQTVGLCHVFCDRKCLVQVSKGLCPWEMSAPLSSSRFLLHCSNSSGEVEGVANYLKIKWFGRHVGNGNAARRGRSWILLQKEIWYLHCWFCSATEPVSVPGVPKNQGVLNIQQLWMNTASSLPVFYGWEGPCDQQDRDTNSHHAKDVRLCLITFEVGGKYLILLESLTLLEIPCVCLIIQPMSFFKSEKGTVA